MNDWVFTFVERSHTERTARLVHAELRLRRIRMLEVRGPEMWENLRDLVQREVLHYKSIRGENDRDIGFRRLMFGFGVHTVEMDFPKINVTATQSEDARLRLEYSYSSEFNKERTWRRFLEVGLDSGNRTYIHSGDHLFATMMEVSKFILKPLIDPKFEPSEDSTHSE